MSTHFPPMHDSSFSIVVDCSVEKKVRKRNGVTALSTQRCHPVGPFQSVRVTYRSCHLLGLISSKHVQSANSQSSATIAVRKAIALSRLQKNSCFVSGHGFSRPIKSHNYEGFRPCSLCPRVNLCARWKYADRFRKWRHQVRRPHPGSYRCCSSMTTLSYAV